MSEVIEIDRLSQEPTQGVPDAIAVSTFLSEKEVAEIYAYAKESRLMCNWEWTEIDGSLVRTKFNGYYSIDSDRQ